MPGMNILRNSFFLKKVASSKSVRFLSVSTPFSYIISRLFSREYDASFFSYSVERSYQVYAERVRDYRAFL